MASSPGVDGRSGGERDRHRQVLAAARREVAAQLTGFRRDFEAFVDGADLVNTDDEHDPEGATIAFERAQVISLRDEAERRLADIDAALARVDDDSFGACTRCGAPIGDERLVALPGTAVCVTCAGRG